MAVKQYIEAIRDALDEEMGADPRVLVMGEDVQEGGVFRATEGLMEKYGAERVLDTPLAESSIVGVAIGAAFNGMRPVAEIQFADFIHPAMNQIISEAARIRYRSNGAFGCPLVVRAPFGGGIHGADGLSIAALARKLSDLGERARARKLTIEDVQGGTFTVDNTGAFGSIMSVPIINYPQAAILTLEAVVPRPIAVDDAPDGQAIAIRHLVNLCISFDHRILDGAQAGAFMASVKAKMEAFGPGTELY